MDTVNQRSSQKGLLNDRNLCRGGAASQRLIHAACNENDGEHNAPIPQPSRELQAIHLRHIKIDEQCIGIKQIAAIKKFMCAGKKSHDKTFTLEQELQGMS